MTGWIGPKLEPGERIVLRHPDHSGGGVWAGVLAVLVAVELVALVAMDKFFGFGRTETMILLLVPVLLVAAVVTRWRLIVTDRRLLCRPGPFGARYNEIRLDAVEDVRIEAGAFAERIVVRANGRETVVATIGVDPAPVVAAIRKAREAAA